MCGSCWGRSVSTKTPPLLKQQGHIQEKEKATNHNLHRSMNYNLTKHSLQKLENTQNYAARIKRNKRKFENITLALKLLHWLPVSEKNCT